MYRSILVPLVLDSDATAARALDLADHLLSGDGTITALHVMEELPGYVTDHLTESHRTALRDELSDLLTEQTRKWPGTDARIVIGHAARAILDQAEALGSDCIVISSHTPGMQDYFLGSTAARVVRHAKCSVHVIR